LNGDVRVWDVDLRQPVRLHLEDSVHYSMKATYDADIEWQALFPGDGLFELEGDLYTTSMFHQLRCLDTLRKDFTALQSSSFNQTSNHTLARHCLNYLRQMILCRSDLHLGPLLGVRRNVHPDALICRDWSLVYSRLALVQSSSKHDDGEIQLPYSEFPLNQ
jgi:hypothetical protein